MFLNSKFGELRVNFMVSFIEGFESGFSIPLDLNDPNIFAAENV